MTTERTVEEPSVACSLEARALADRRAELRAGILSRVVETRAIEVEAGDGLALALPAGLGTRRELEELIEFESRCCGFAQYAIRAEPQRSLLWLQIVGPPGTRALFERLGGPQAGGNGSAGRDPVDGAERAEHPDRAKRVGLAGVAGAGSAALALVLCASPALPIVLGAAGLGASFARVAGWIDTFAPPLLVAGLLMAVGARIRRRPSNAA